MAKRQTNLNTVHSALALTVSPWRNYNQVQLHINAESFFPAMLAAIADAKYYVLLEMYLFESGVVANQFIDAFIESANQDVKIYLLLDDFGCRGLKSKDRKRLEHKNILISYYNPLKYGAFRRNLFRDHRKLLVVDQTVSFVGGAGITDDFQTFDRAKPGWRETMISVKGECVRDWVKAFSHVWEIHANINLPAISNPEIKPNQIVPSRVICALGSARRGIKSSVLKRIRNSERTCWIATAYFVPSFNIRWALGRAAKRGVDVRLLLPGPISDHPVIRLAARRFYYNLLKEGVKIYEYQPRFMHQKVLLCDAWVSIGSSNIDRWNFRWNLEANQEVEDQDFVDSVTQMLEKDFSESKQYLLENWIRRAWYHRMQEWFWGHVDRFIDRYIR